MTAVRRKEAAKATVANNKMKIYSLFMLLCSSNALREAFPVNLFLSLTASIAPYRVQYLWDRNSLGQCDTHL